MNELVELKNEDLLNVDGGIGIVGSLNCTLCQGHFELV